MRSRGSIAFAKCTGTSRDWAQRLGLSVQSVGAYRTGDRSPSNETRQKIEDMGGPAAILWDEPAPLGLPRAPRPKREAPTEATPDDTAAVAAALLGHIQGLQAELDDPEATSELELPQRIRCADQLAAAADKLSRITGVRLTERMILASPLWAELLEKIVAALDPWPDAQRAVATAITPATKDPKA